ncbi:uncharacterized protein V6R79_020740 [Siganus canaliculatus]
MAADVTVTQETLSGGLTQLVNASSDLLEKAKQEAAESLESFVAGKITALFGLTAVASQFYKTLGVTKKQEAEAVWQKYYHHAAVREQVDELLEVESEWDSFLERVDRDLQTTDTQLSGGKKADSLSPDLQFTDARTGKSVTLGQYLHEGQKLLLADLSARSVKVLVVTFGGQEGANIWLEQTGCTFDMVLDKPRKTYRSFGLGSSYAKVIKFSFLMKVSELIAEKGVPQVPPHLLEDIYQMGGDFLLDEAGKVILRHPSTNPLDRPSVTEILQAADPSKL